MQAAEKLTQNHTSEFSSNIESTFWSSNTALICLTALAAFLSFYGLGALEFFRHTEADRTLIGWEMLRSGNYLVPHLLGSTILTKPPLFYWTVAGSFSLTGLESEWAARLPSAFASVLVVMANFLILRSLAMPSWLVFISSLFFATGLHFHSLAIVAEIDMLYGFFSTISLYCIFLYFEKKGHWPLVLGYACLALAFLTKGPPTIAFFGVSILVYYFASKNYYQLSFKKFFFEQLTFSLVALLIVGAWLFALATEVSWQALYLQFEREILDRAIGESGRARGWYYYLAQLPKSLAPWSICLLGLLYFKRIRILDPKLFNFFLFNLIIFSSAIFMLSLADGKAGRYLFPVYAFGMNLCAFGLYLLIGSKLDKYLYHFALGISLLAIPTIIAVPFVLNLPGVTVISYAVSISALLIACLVLAYFSYKKLGRGCLFAIVLLLCAAKLTEVHLFAAHRNHTRSVKPIAQAINEVLPPGKALYTFELFERWIIYYLIRDSGRESYRLSPTKQASLSDTDILYFLVNTKEEAWRIDILNAEDPDFQLLANYQDDKEPLVLIRASAKAVKLLPISEAFPVVPTSPEDYQS